MNSESPAKLSVGYLARLLLPYLERIVLLQSGHQYEMDKLRIGKSVPRRHLHQLPPSLHVAEEVPIITFRSVAGACS